MDATQEGALLDRIENYLTAQDTPATEEPKQEDVADEPKGESEEVTAEVEEPEAEQEPKDDVQDEGEESHLEISHLANYLGVDEDRLDVDEDGTVYVKTKIDGEEGRAKFQDLVKSYQLEGHLNKQNMEVAEQKKALQAKIAEVEQQATQRVQQLESLTKLAWDELNREYNAVNWQELRQYDPAEYAAKLADFQQRDARIRSALSHLDQEKSQSEQVKQAKLAEKLAESEKLVLQSIPEWMNQEVANRDVAKLKEYLPKAGFTLDENDYLTDHRFVVMLRKAMLYDDLQQSKDIVTKKVVKAPKLVKPGSPQTKQERDGKTITALKSTIKKSGGDKGIEEYLLRTGKV